MAEVQTDPCLRDKKIVITGAGRGLGRALAIIAADHGAETILLGRNLEKLQEAANAISERAGPEPLVVPCDLAEPGSIASACESVLSQKPTIDVLVNNGAPWLVGDLEDISDEDITATVAAAISGTILVTRGILPGLNRSSAADIITVVSTSGIPGWDLRGGSVPFYAAKHGQSGFSDKLRYELSGRGIRVSAIYPPDFDDVDPTEPAWDDPPERRTKISNREVVSALLFMLTAPRTCSFPVVVMGGTNRGSTTPA